MGLENAVEANLISETDLAAIRIKLGKSHRSKKDWTLIQDILKGHDLLLLIEGKDDIHQGGYVYEDWNLITFSNYKDCREYIRWVNELDCVPDRKFEIAPTKLEDVFSMSKRDKKRVWIDFVSTEVNSKVKFLQYSPEEDWLEAMMLG